MTNVQVQCCHCMGRGSIEDYKVVNGQVIGYYWAKDPFRMTKCPTCNGFGVVIATELKAVTQWEQVKSQEGRKA